MAINKCYLSGRLTKDPELRYTQSGAAVCQFTLAVDDVPRDGNTNTHFLNCVIWQKRAEVIAQHVKKGDQLFIEARVQTRSYENKEGQKVYVTEFVVNDFDFGKQSGGGNNNNNNNNSNRSNNSGGNNRYPDNPFTSDQKPIDISDDDLPF